jgi:hypothetical protein
MTTTTKKDGRNHLFYQIQNLKKKRNCPFNPAETRSEQSKAAGPEAKIKKMIKRPSFFKSKI